MELGGKFKRRIARGCKQSAGKEFRVVSLSVGNTWCDDAQRSRTDDVEARSVKL